MSAKRRTPTAAALCRRAVDLGAIEAKAVSPRNVFTAHWVRMKCRYGCGGFGSSRNCPPHSPEPDETRRILDEYHRAILVHGSRITDIRRVVVTLEREAFLGGFYKAFAFACGPCELCPRCAFDKGCRHPNDARPSMEACGIDVYRTARAAGFPIRVVTSQSDEPNYYGLVLLE